MSLFRMRYPSARTLVICVLALLIAVMFQETALAAKPKQKTFGTPEAAVEALVKALRDGSEKELLAIFGPGSESLISSGDKVDDRDEKAKFIGNMMRRIAWKRKTRRKSFSMWGAMTGRSRSRS